ncbi:methyl-accepting chemotaxis protein [Caloramator australicus]|uniref:Methyl-accepting chemotaxis protein n=1 Tax=Caloramator australicus RC3 TaxID=857293 RepID=G0V4E6_9CLOT|nr:methyl-accepting chemotaxis protein [Caloramator australicus]CCC57986.1 Methyl-accepting chemotaxis protein [Caloramator australicus RC3]
MKKMAGTSIKIKLVAMFITVIVFSMGILGIASYGISKKSLSDLGNRALKNKINMGITFMEALESQVQEGKLTREEAQEIFKSKMLNPKKGDGKTRGQNEKLELDIGAYMFAINSQGIEMMHPFKEGDDISNIVDPKGNNIVKLIIEEGKHPKNNGIIKYYWKNPGENKIRAKTNAVAYFEPWDWYVNVGAYDEDFYRPAQKVLNIILLFSLINLLVGSSLILWFLNKKLNPLKELSESMKEVAEGNLNIELEIKSNDEIGKIQESFGKMLKAQREMIKKIKVSVEEVLGQSENLSATSEEMASSSQEVAKTMQQIAEGSSSQANDLQEIVGLMTELTQNIENALRELATVKDETLNTSNRANIGKSEMDKLIRTIEDIKNAFEIVTLKVNNLTNSVKEISNITNVITSIAEQTNLLALNAAIEAARAGEAGRGFAVVADEVRKLAEESKKSASEIVELVNSIEKDTDDVIITSKDVDGFIKSQATAVEKTVASFGDILESIERIAPLMKNTYNAMDEMVSSKDKVLLKVEAVSAVTEENTAAAEEVAASSEELSASSQEVAATANTLNQLATDLANAVERFRLN